ncbi:MAG TPA: DUF2158 domain-containing protein [Chthoniobacterales bacterium]|jgi:uncharacterized protein YodC (DUF2158 family)|nr:DUF2158 domain-containing protein [Chthoniobacterales bacterium]
MKTQHSGSLSSEKHEDNKLGNPQPEGDNSLPGKIRSSPGQKATSPAQAGMTERVTVEHAPTADDVSVERGKSIPVQVAGPVQAETKRTFETAKQDEAPLRYQLGKRDSGVFFWRDFYTGEEGSFDTTSKPDAQRLLNWLNESHYRQFLRPKEAVGELVELKSGGPAMTIVKALGNGNVLCQWFRGNTIKKKTFPMEALQIAQLKKRVRRNASKHRPKAKTA